MSRRLRVGVCPDFAEERWPSMDLVGEMVLSHLRRDHAAEVAVTEVRPPYRHRLGGLPRAGRLGAARNADRLLNRFRDYPRALRDRARRVLQSQNDGWPEEHRQDARRELNRAYDRFVFLYGPINKTTFGESEGGHVIRRMPNIVPVIPAMSPSVA